MRKETQWGELIVTMRMLNADDDCEREACFTVSPFTGAPTPIQFQRLFYWIARSGQTPGNIIVNPVLTRSTRFAVGAGGLHLQIMKNDDLTANEWLCVMYEVWGLMRGSCGIMSWYNLDQAGHARLY